MIHLFKKRKVIEEVYDSLYFTHCHDCGKRIIVEIPQEYGNQWRSDCHSCNECTPINSSARNNIDESIFIDISDKLWNE